MNKYNLIAASLILVAAMALSLNSFGAETIAEKAETAGNKTADVVKRTYRNAKNEVCEMIDGKAKCAIKKVVNKVKNTADTIETKTNEAKNKAD